MMNDKSRRQELADFLRSRRERLTLREVGLPDTTRRRTPGLRREEIAQLAGISTSWYTALEQARMIHPSEEVLDSLARAMQLTPTERRHLFTLTWQQPTREWAEHEENASSEIQKLIHSFDTNPAYVIGRRWDLIDWNQSAELVFGFGALQPPYQRNLMWRLFANPTWQHDERWELVARISVARFRTDSARYPGDPSFEGLIQDLQQISDQFCLWWSQHDVQPIEDKHKEIDHPKLGHLQFDHVILQAPENPDLRIFIYMSSPKTAIRLRQAQS